MDAFLGVSIVDICFIYEYVRATRADNMENGG